jgi:hypothetical protein
VRPRPSPGRLPLAAHGIGPNAGLPVGAKRGLAQPAERRLDDIEEVKFCQNCIASTRSLSPNLALMFRSSVSDAALLVVFPVVLFYTAVFSIFRGKVRKVRRSMGLDRNPPPYSRERPPRR